MKLIVGLGNPGRNYIDSRHNIGFLIIKYLAKACGIAFKKDSNTFSLSGKERIGGQTVMLAMPVTFMNLSGVAVLALLKKYKVDLESLLVVCDDLDLKFGRIKIRASGSSGGHRGLQSIIDSIESQDFCRLRIGIGRPQNKYVDPAEYVLSAFTKKEKEKARELIKIAGDCCRVWIKKGIIESMDIFNRRSN